MKPILLDPETYTIKVISIDLDSISLATFNQLKEYPTYEDTMIGEDLYSCTVSEDIKCREHMHTDVALELAQIEKLCEDNDASYFRLVEL